MKKKNKNNLKAFLPLIIVCIVLIAAIGLILTLNGNNDEPKDSQSTIQSSNASTESTASEDPYGDSITNIGSGQVSFILNVVDREGYSQLYRIHTDKKMVGEALLEQRLIEGEEGAYGLYIKSVLGITADYDKDQTYWAFYIDGEYAMTGVDQTEVKEGTEYSFIVEK